MSRMVLRRVITMFGFRFMNNKVAVTTYIQKRNLSLYHRGVQFFFKQNLVMTNSITAGIFLATGDLIHQEFQYKTQHLKKRYDWARAGRMFLVGAMVGPLFTYYYLYIEKILPKSDMITVMKKVACDQIFVSPSSITFFYYAMGYLEKKSFSESTDEFCKKFKYVYLGDCCYWPPIQIINFYYIPSHYRVVYINAATMVFNIFVSYIKHYDQH